MEERRRKKGWLRDLIAAYGHKAGELNFIFLDDEALLQINMTYLNHSTYTDIITFDHSEQENRIEGDVFISVDRVMENAAKFKTTFERELLRVMAHGVLHLLGFKDKKTDEVQAMRQAEDQALELYFRESA